METHENDPTPGDPSDPWNTVQTEFGDLGRRIKETYRRVASEDGPSEEEIKDAFGTLMGAWGQVAESVTTALRDPDVREHLKGAASSLASALGTTITELGSELSDQDRRSNAADDGTAGEEE
ncbi:MAG TPA: hypothetical protein VMM14_09210 [Acidimicrobiia bacterium]|nr:hypothetical protein [Acidimicrobiia bacterium]